MSKWFSVAVLSSVIFSQWAVAAQAPASAPRAMGPLVSGFVDAQAQWNRGSLDLGSGLGISGSGTGFAVNQGAIVLSDELEGAELTVDIPFRQNTSPTGTSNNNFEVGTKEAQAFVKFQHDWGLFWQLGQFDSIVGIESNDTSDLILPQHGILHRFVPNTHTGALVGYSFLPFFVNFVVGNANSASVQDPESGEQFAARVGWSQEPVQFTVAATYTKSHGNYTLSSGENPEYKPEILLDAILQADFDKFTLGAEVDIKQSRQSRAATVTGPKSHDLVMGLLVLGTYSISDKWAAAVRYEYLKNDETNEYIQAAQSQVALNRLSGQGGYLSKFSAGVRRTINDELSVKIGVDYNNLNIGRDNLAEGKSKSWAQAQVAAVYDF